MGAAPGANTPGQLPSSMSQIPGSLPGQQTMPGALPTAAGQLGAASGQLPGMGAPGQQQLAPGQQQIPGSGAPGPALPGQPEASQKPTLQKQKSSKAGEEGEVEHVSWNKKNIMKWEKDEPLGTGATISPVLYCNMNHPELKEKYPEWTERAKQISKIWRKVPTDQKNPYLVRNE